MTIAETDVFEFDNSFARDLEGFYVEWKAASAPEPHLVAFNDELATELGLDASYLSSPEGLAVLAGNTVPDGANPIAMVYAGHQFGGYSPRLGDGRALLVGELLNAEGDRFDLHLKGSGRTPFARGGDGKAALGPMLREYLVAEAMHALRVPTTRALSVVTTGESIFREGMVPGAILARVAASHLRVGTFEFAARLEDKTALTRLADYSIQRHHPAAAESDARYLGLLEAVVDAQAALVARWMLLGFIHGVLNTDNVTISGEGIDYGPCAFMDGYDPKTVFSSIDHAGRYAFGNQPSISVWNLARLAETLLPLMGPDQDAAIESATVLLQSFPDRYHGYWLEGMRAKLGLAGKSDADDELATGLTDLLEASGADYTGSFRALSGSLRGDSAMLQQLFTDDKALGEWLEMWHARLDCDGRERSEVADEMDQVNPVYIPRNHLLEAALTAATEGDLEPFEELYSVVTNPFEKRDGLDRYAEAAPESFGGNYQTFCGT